MLTLSAIMVALGTVLSLIKIIKMPLGGSVTLLSMLPIVMISVMLGVKWGLGSAFVYSLLQLFLGIALDGLLGWGLTPVMLIGTICLDYIVPFTCLGLAGIFQKRGYLGICSGITLALLLRFASHFVSGFIIFKELEQFELFGRLFANRPVLYSLGYNGFYMLPELALTLIAATLLFRIPRIKKMISDQIKGLFTE
ncbi:MAG: energy-coupled thiamine transporter ThiT [Clostridia bacterium]|nr:energy-coupled thiamine transporter ThiT [Clostridia bacterium]